jgi:hypothetical protein
MTALLQQCESRVDELKLEQIKNDEKLARSQQQHIAEIEKLLEGLSEVFKISNFFILIDQNISIFFQNIAT